MVATCRGAREVAGVTDGWRIAAIAVLGVVVSGVADHLLTTAGYVGLGRLVWMVGFGVTVLAVWYLWLRPMDLTGPGG